MRMELTKIKLDSNENQLEHYLDIINCIKEIDPKKYPDVTISELRRKIAISCGVKQNEIFCSNGSDILIKVITLGLLKTTDEVIIPEIAFPTYEIAAKIKECKYKKIPLKNYGIDLETTFDAITDDTKLIWISNPHNPTGTILEPEEIEEFLEKVPEHIHVVLDEAYVEFLTEKIPDTIRLYNKFKNLIVLRTFSKAYGLAGARVGYGFAREEIINSFKHVIGPFDLNSYAQALAIKIIDEKEYVKEVREANKKAMDFYESLFKELNLDYIKSYASFVMVNAGEKADFICEKLLEENIIIKNGKHIEMENWIRISMGNQEQNLKVAKILRDILK